MTKRCMGATDTRMTAEEWQRVAEAIRKARRNPQRLTRERALRLFEEHRIAAKQSQLALNVDSKSEDTLPA